MSQKLIGSLARPFKVDLALRPVSSGLEKGAEIFGEPPFGAPAVDGLHVEGVAENELDSLSAAEIGDPVPREHALDGDDEVVPEGLDRLEELLGLAGDVAVEEDGSLGV